MVLLCSYATFLVVENSDASIAVQLLHHDLRGDVDPQGEAWRGRLRPGELDAVSKRFPLLSDRLLRRPNAAAPPSLSLPRALSISTHCWITCCILRRTSTTRTPSTGCGGSSGVETPTKTLLPAVRDHPSKYFNFDGFTLFVSVQSAAMTPRPCAASSGPPISWPTVAGPAASVSACLSAKIASGLATMKAMTTTCLRVKQEALATAEIPQS